MRVVTGSEFERMVNRLRKRFRLVDSDIRLLAAELELGRRPQDERLQNMGEMTIYKARLRNTSARRGSRRVTLLQAFRYHAQHTRTKPARRAP